MRMMTLLLAPALITAPLAAQEGEWPADWQVRFDRASAARSDLRFETMSPGWHITTGPACILYKPDDTVSGAFRVESTIFLFDPGRRHREAYGLFVGGRNLDGAEQAYTYFLIRDTGEFLLKRREGSGTATIQGWTASDAIVPHPGGDEQAENTLAIEADAETVRFFINGEQVAGLPRSSVAVDGIVGLRVNHSLNLHVADLTVENR